MSLFLDRTPRSRRFLVWKTRLFAVAAVLVLVGMALNNPYVTGAAFLPLFVGIALRFVPEPRATPEPPEPEEPRSEEPRG